MNHGERRGPRRFFCLTRSHRGVRRWHEDFGSLELWRNASFALQNLWVKTGYTLSIQASTGLTCFDPVISSLGVALSLFILCLLKGWKGRKVLRFSVFDCLFCFCWFVRNVWLEPADFLSGAYGSEVVCEFFFDAVDFSFIV